MRTRIRDELVPRRRYVFQAVYQELRYNQDGQGNACPTALVYSVIEYETKRAITQHLWLAIPPGQFDKFMALKMSQGDTISFSAYGCKYTRVNGDEDYGLNAPQGWLIVRRGSL